MAIMPGTPRRMHPPKGGIQLANADGKELPADLDPGSFFTYFLTLI